MEYSLAIRLCAEFFGTAIMVILGNGSVATVDLEKTKGSHGGWIVIAVGYGFAVMIPALMFGTISGNHINPAFTIGLALSGLFPWSDVLPYITVQLLGAIIGQFIVYLCFKPHYDLTKNTALVLGTFSTSDATSSRLNGFINEFFGTFILVFGALGITNSPSFSHGNQMSGFIGIGLLVMVIVASFGGPTGPALNPARDLGPRILHQLLPLKYKGTSNWKYSWVPVVAPILAGILAVALYKIIFL
ncbi:MIP/aquaporin family protein [Liquorilactobacillus mali]|uniref:Glycerol uptake facilitator protein n=1 Tax=Liquorilactobacillus mali TaxID=1618 RepID=A0A0R2FUS1_9LACO|nr:MIP/aquaporin family protein [Liquorilactobacillus mali]KRN28564.1 glycerol uptake facilitator protein [Liquorilactobacillus mali]MDN7146211.1 MIP/aquaporin family protein [Liquorilactobacillus mali]MDV7758051.1 MIP family channel protein [Liquorilactobacillus mali]